MNWSGREVSRQPRFKLSRNVMTIVYDLAGHEEWLRLRQVCRLFDDASYSMAKSWPVWAQEQLEILVEEEKHLLESDQLAELLATVKEDIDTNYNTVVSHPKMKNRFFRLISERKTCFGIERRWKPADQVSAFNMNSGAKSNH